MAASNLEVNQQIPSISKKITQDRINQFEACGLSEDRQNFHNNPEEALKKLGGRQTDLTSGNTYRFRPDVVGLCLRKRTQVFRP